MKPISMLSPTFPVGHQGECPITPRSGKMESIRLFTNQIITKEDIQMKHRNQSTIRVDRRSFIEEFVCHFGGMNIEQRGAQDIEIYEVT
jgi:hypothetical protein